MVQRGPGVVVLQYGSLLKAARGQQDDISELDAIQSLIEKVGRKGSCSIGSVSHIA